MSPRVADRDLLEAGAREAAEAILRLSHHESARILTAGSEPLSALIARLGPRAVVVGFTVNGGVNGRFALAVDEAGAHALSAAMTGGGAPGAGKDKLGKRALAALTELGNIAASAFMNGAAELLHKSCVPSVPSLAFGDPAELLPAALGNGSAAQVARVAIGDLHVELALAR